MPTAAEDIQDGNIRHMIFLQRYSTQTVRKVIALLSRLDSRLAERLLREDISTISRSRLERLLDNVRSINAAAQKQVRGELRGELRELAKLEGDFQARLMKGSIPVAVDMVTPPAQLLIAAVNSRPFEGRLLKDWFRDLEANSFNRLKRSIQMGVAEGATTEEMIRRVRGTKTNGFKDGILEISRRGAEATVRTAVNHTASAARDRLYEENADLIKGEKWVSTLDGRTSAICRGLDGQVFDLDKGPRPPAHINCRSTTTPVLKSWKELGINLKEAPEGTRASMNGQVPANMTYGEWLKTQSKEFQDDVLGKRKGQLFRKGGLTMDKFVDRNGAELTLDQLRQRESAAFAKAFGAAKKAAKKTPTPEPNRAFRFEGIAPPKNVQQAEDMITSFGVATGAKLKGVAIKDISGSFIAMAEVTERFGLAPLNGVGPSTRFGLKKTKNANAAIFSGRRNGERFGVFHTPTNFGSRSRYDRQTKIADANHAKYLAERKRELDGNRFTPIDAEVFARIEKMPEKDYNWTLSSILGHGPAQRNIVYHEYGHVLHLVDERIGAEINKFLASETPVKKGWHLLLSRYAGANTKEYVAEAFAAYMQGKKQHYRIHPKLLEIFKRFDVSV